MAEGPAALILDAPVPPRLLVRPATARRILDRLERQHPGADTELDFTTPFELLVATILSAQCTDARVNQVTPKLFAAYPDADALARVNPQDIEPVIQPTGFFRMKSRNIVQMARALVKQHGGEVPAEMDALVALPGVGRKTANVVLGHALGKPGLPVDRHVLRVANRIGLVKSDDPVAVEAALGRTRPPDRWTRLSDTLILHGRRVCKPKPLCDRCLVPPDCVYFRTLGAKAPARPPRHTKAARRRPAR